jgi:hypothetical protein
MSLPPVAYIQVCLTGCPPHTCTWLHVCPLLPIWFFTSVNSHIPMQLRLQAHDCLPLHVSFSVVSDMHIHSVGSSHICCEKRPIYRDINITMCHSVCHVCMYWYVYLILWSHDCTHVCPLKYTPIFLCTCSIVRIVVMGIREIIHSSIISNFPLISINSSHYKCEVTTTNTYCMVKI